MLGSLLIQEESSEPPAGDEGSDGFWPMLRRRQVWPIALVMLLIGIPFGTLDTFISLLINSSGLAWNPGWFFTINYLPDLEEKEYSLVAAEISNEIRNSELKCISPAAEALVILVILDIPATPEKPDIEWDLIEEFDDLVDALNKLYDWADFYRVLID